MEILSLVLCSRSYRRTSDDNVDARKMKRAYANDGSIN